VNVKDVLVQLMTIAFFLYTIRFVRRREKGSLAICCLLFFAFLHVRFYIPFIIAGAAAIWVFLEWRDVRKYPLLAGGLVMGLWMLPGRAWRLWESVAFFDIAYGICRFTLTPQPWDIQDSYTFLFLPATLHWLMILPAVAGGMMLWRDSRVARLVLLYCGIMIFLYGVAEDIQGTRQRVQLSYIFAWMQMHFLWRWTHSPVHKSASMAGLRRHAAPLPARAA
jgi:hypothetical protein